MFVHIVFFRFKDISDVPEAKRRLESLKGAIKGLEHIEVGIDVVRKSHSWDLILDTRFQNKAAYEAYAKDPVHLEVVKWLKPAITEKATVDYESNQ